MCGICGVATTNTARPPDRAVVETMTDALVHRGPDAGGLWSQGCYALGARRLSVIDVAHGHQPMANEDNSICVAFNGEIYNAAELRAELEGKGQAFRTQCDTEVVLRAYEAWGEEAVVRFNGMFAFAIADTRDERLYLARDRVGIKPLYFTERDGVLAFSSELDSLLRSGYVSGALDAGALDAYFTYLYVPHPDSIFDGVRKLGPGEALVWERGSVRTTAYWRPEFRVDTSWTFDSAAEAYCDLLEDAVRLQRFSDVPLGAFLSGGVDSSSVVALLSEQLDSPVETFTIGFEDAEADESAYAGIAASAYETNHHVAIMAPDVASIAPELVPHFGEPFADSSAVPTWLVSKLAREHVTVALSGDGGDELFAGYSWLHMNRKVEGYRRIPVELRRLIDAALRIAPRSGLRDKLWRASGDSFLTADESFRRRQTCFGPGMRAALYGPALGEAVARSAQDRFQEHMDCANSLGPDDQMLHQDLRMYLPDDILTKVDRMSMAVSLEARVPLLDHRLVEFAATLPFEFKYNGRVSKRVVKHALRERIPAALLQQRKRGFAIPVHRWFREELGETFRAFVLGDDARSRDYLNMEWVEGVFEKHGQGHGAYGHHLWALLMFEHWLRYAGKLRPLWL